MQTPAWWEQLLLGLMAALLVWWSLPGIKAALARSRATERKDWRGALLPIAAVVVFVFLLIALVRRH